MNEENRREERMSREVMVKRNVLVPVGGGMFLIYYLILFLHLLVLRLLMHYISSQEK